MSNSLSYLLWIAAYCRGVQSEMQGRLAYQKSLREEESTVANLQ